MANILILEPFYGGSHKQLLDTIFEGKSFCLFDFFCCLANKTDKFLMCVLILGVNPAQYELYSLPAKKWHWRARTSALFFSQTIPLDHQYRYILTSSVLNLAELLGVRADLAKCKKIVYFHENQLVYPVREIKERDCQYGMNQIMTWFVHLPMRVNYYYYY